MSKAKTCPALGAIVRYSSAFLRATGQYYGSAGSRKGRIVGYDGNWAKVVWQGDMNHSLVHCTNLHPVGKPERFD